MNDERFGGSGEASAAENGETPDLELDLDAPTDPMIEAIEASDPVDPIDDPGDPAATIIVSESARLRAEVADWRDRGLRTLADFDNFRKRAEREKEEVRKYALADFLREFVAVADNFDLALRSGGSGEDLRRGVEMIHRQFDEHLRRFGLRPVEAMGVEFDPAVHEAVARREDPTVTRPTVVAELRKGYFLGDRLLRPAMVEVAVPLETPTRAAVDGESI